MAATGVGSVCRTEEVNCDVLDGVSLDSRDGISSLSYVRARSPKEGWRLGANVRSKCTKMYHYIKGDVYGQHLYNITKR